MKWVYRGLMAAGTILAGVVSAGLLPVAYGAVATAVVGGAAFFHDSPSQAK